MYSQRLGNHFFESFGGVTFDLGPLIQGQIMVAQHKSAYISLIIGSRGF